MDPQNNYGLNMDDNGLNESSEAKGEANTWINPLNQNQLAPPLYTQPGTNSGNNSPSPQPGPSRAPERPLTRREKKQLADKKYRQKLKDERNKLESNLVGLQKENQKLKRENKSLTQEKDLAVKKLHQTNYEKNQLESELCRLRHQSASFRICVDAFTQKVLSCDNVRVQLKQLKDELASLSEGIDWDDIMQEKLNFLNRIEELKNQNKVLKVQVEAVCEKIYKQ